MQGEVQYLFSGGGTFLNIHGFSSFHSLYIMFLYFKNMSQSPTECERMYEWGWQVSTAVTGTISWPSTFHCYMQRTDHFYRSRWRWERKPLFFLLLRYWQKETKHQSQLLTTDRYLPPLPAALCRLSDNHTPPKSPTMPLNRIFMTQKTV